ncbi:exopolysaccharide biosynthesis protein [Oryzifoliimicrobium ureilyticus]|uniref:exopolysaccharide biosynthesis protein n=1 Tax=Oryzifoliimicrobium ureilyticus TaxID=3113724 RepID=UPI0030765F2D
MRDDSATPDRGQEGVASSRLRDVAKLAREDGGLSISEIIAVMGPAGKAFTILVLALPALTPIPGPFGMVFGTALALVSLQVATGRETLWLPNILGKRRLSARVLEIIVNHTLPLVSKVERVVCSGRLKSLTGRKAEALIGIPVFLLAVAIALPIPFGNFLPVIAVMTLAVGLMEQDGLVTLIGLGMTLLAVIATIFLLYGAASLVSGIGA